MCIGEVRDDSAEEKDVHDDFCEDITESSRMAVQPNKMAIPIAKRRNGSFGAKILANASARLVRLVHTTQVNMNVPIKYLTSCAGGVCVGES